MFLLNEVRRCNRNLIILSLAMIVLVFIIMFIPTYNYYVTNKSPELLDINKVKSGDYKIGIFSDYYDLEGSSFISTGAEDFIGHYEFGGETKEIIQDSDYVLVKYEEYWIPVRLQDKTNLFSTKYRGKLAGINDEVINELKKRAAKVNSEDYNPDMLLDIALDTTIEVGIITYIAIFISFVLVIIIISNFFKVLYRHRNPYSSPFIRNLYIYGDVEDVINSIEDEISYEVFTYGKVINTESWFIIE